MSEIPAFTYSDLWGERVIRSLANLTREDGLQFLPLAAAAGVRTHVRVMPPAAANQALERLRRGEVEGAIVLTP
jgi:propanol-preferring alcohol dehydrogenase